MRLNNEERYFIILVGRMGEFYDRSGPAFILLLMMDDNCLTVYTLGIYSDKGKPAFGRVPEKSYKEVISNYQRDDDVILRLRIDSTQYSDCLFIILGWEKRVNENALLYSELAMNNILFVKQITERLNHNKPVFKLYKLDWGLQDYISEYNPPLIIPYLYFKELKRLNDDVHVTNDQFQSFMQAIKEK